MSIIEKLSEGIVNRDMKAEGAALLNKWESTGLLEGLTNQHQKSTMARLLENQAKELLRESNTMQAGDVEGFAAVAFPIVRRVFAGLIANDLVSVQPMSLPSGLIFFLDFQFGSTPAGSKQGQGTESIYGQGVKGSQITGGVNLSSDNLDKQPYGMMSAYASATSSVNDAVFANIDNYEDGTAVTAAEINGSKALSAVLAGPDAEKVKKLLRYDPDVLAADTLFYRFLKVTKSELTNISSQNGHLEKIDLSQGVAASLFGSDDTGSPKQIRRLSRNHAGESGEVLLVVAGTGSLSGVAVTTLTASFPVTDGIEAAGADALGALKGANFFPLENEGAIPEIDIRVDSISITAQTKKLKAKWTPELGQDLNAYHNLDAEVELTSILSEQIALEIDREILSDLINGATAATYYWSRSPGLFVNRETGAELGATAASPDFTGTVSEWYETLIETINDVSAQIHRKTLRGGANYVVVSPEVANILEFTSGFRANVTADADKGEIGAVKVGSLSRKFDVIVDPYFPRNAVLVGRKGGSFLESGYVYAPYVPLQTTPTIFGVDDFVPRKGVMTRYAKKMVRPDMYGLVICRGLLGESGS